MTTKAVSRPISSKIREAIDAMVWEGLEYTAAGERVGLSARTMRKALQRPAVLACFRSERAALLASEGPRTVRRLAALRDQSRNMNAAVSAARALEGIIPHDDRALPGSVPQMPGLVIVIGHTANDPASRLVAPSHRTIEIAPNDK